MRTKNGYTKDLLEQYQIARTAMLATAALHHDLDLGNPTTPAPQDFRLRICMLEVVYVCRSACTAAERPKPWAEASALELCGAFDRDCESPSAEADCAMVEW